MELGIGCDIEFGSAGTGGGYTDDSGNTRINMVATMTDPASFFSGLFIFIIL